MVFGFYRMLKVFGKIIFFKARPKLVGDCFLAHMYAYNVFLKNFSSGEIIFVDGSACGNNF
jgi:hypothetical protein